MFDYCNNCQIYADQLSVDDEVLVEGNNELIPVKEINVYSVTMQGTNFSFLVVKLVWNN